MKINEVIGEWIAMPHTAKSMGLRKANSHWMPINVGNNKANEKAPPGREKQVRALKGKVDNPYAVAWASYNKSKNKKEDAMGVGTITKQNTTKDVNGGTLNKMLRNLHLIK